MDATDERLKEIKERLEAATPGPWTIAGWGIWSEAAGTYVVEDSEGVSDNPATAQFIVNAPDDIAWLIEQLEAVPSLAEAAYVQGQEDAVEWE